MLTGLMPGGESALDSPPSSFWRSRPESDAAAAAEATAATSDPLCVSSDAFEVTDSDANDDCDDPAEGAVEVGEGAAAGRSAGSSAIRASGEAPARRLPAPAPAPAPAAAVGDGAARSHCSGSAPAGPSG